MTNLREPESQAVLEAKAELETIVEELRAVKGRVVAVRRRLLRAAAAAPIAAVFEDGSRETAEGWMAGSLKELVREELGNAIRGLTLEVRTDWRPEIRRVAAAERAHRARHHQVPASTEPPTVAEANRAAVLAVMQREGVRVDQVAGRTCATVRITL
jgi:hypothetical protein